MNTFNPFLAIKQKRPKFELDWVERTFAAGNTFRAFKGRKADKIRRVVRSTIVRARNLARARSQLQYDSALNSYTKTIEKKARLQFGYASKLANLYIKELVSRPGILPDRWAASIRRYAHVPIDQHILGYMRVHFDGDAAIQAVPKGVPLKKIKREQAADLQKMLRAPARRASVNPIDYDLWWSADISRKQGRRSERRKHR